jgi:hypothetical protein
MLIPLTKGLFCEIDDDDAHLVEPYRWYAQSSKRGIHYAQRRITTDAGVRKMVFMHRMICGASEGQLVDHIDNNGLNNKRANLRLCSHSENRANAAGLNNSLTSLKNVYFCQRSVNRPWRVDISIGNTRYRAQFATEAEAIADAATNRARLHGSFAYTPHRDYRSSHEANP